MRISQLEKVRISFVTSYPTGSWNSYPAKLPNKNVSNVQVRIHIGTVYKTSSGLETVRRILSLQPFKKKGKSGWQRSRRLWQQYMGGPPLASFVCFFSLSSEHGSIVFITTSEVAMCLLETIKGRISVNWKQWAFMFLKVRRGPLRFALSRIRRSWRHSSVTVQLT